VQHAVHFSPSNRHTLLAAARQCVYIHNFASTQRPNSLLHYPSQFLNNLQHDPTRRQFRSTDPFQILALYFIQVEEYTGQQADRHICGPFKSATSGYLYRASKTLTLPHPLSLSKRFLHLHRHPCGETLEYTGEEALQAPLSVPSASQVALSVD
jgi:hypothetical protein